jgi:uncharacterized membrane protein
MVNIISRLNKLNAHHRLYISLTVALIVFFAFSGTLPSSTRLLVTWLAYALTSITLAWVMILTSHPAEIKLEAHNQDSSRTTVFLFAVAASFASLFAIVILLRSSGDKSHMDILFQIILPVICVISSWWLVQTIFTLRYANFYYSDIEHHSKKQKPGGLDFPQENRPDYLDFTYFAFVIGMTFQVSDVEITSKRIRRLAWMHGVLSFAFNTIIVALTINIISGLVQNK